MMPYHIEKSDNYFEVIDDAGKVVGKHPTRKLATEQLRALYANVPEAKEAASKSGDYLIAEDEAHPTTWHLQVKKDGKPDHTLMGAAWAALHGGYRGNKYEGPDKGKAIEKLKKLYEDEDMPVPAEKEAQGIVDRVLAFIKEGRRNSSGDADRLQQIHDLAVANGADCMFSVKEVNGAYRWVLLSSNSFQDTDKEIVSQKALEADVSRTDKENNGDFGPLRWWHMGNPDPVRRVPGDGIDIGTCDFRAMQGRTLIESGTFKDKRVAAALKNCADSLAASIGFFHPLTEPDGEGVYNTIQVFERSVLPRLKASNQLTALTVKTQTEDQDMATMKEKWDEFVTMLGGDEAMARSVVKQAQETEAKADEKGLKFKEAEQAEQPAPVAAEAEKAKAETEPDGDEAAEKVDEMKAFEDKFMPLIEKKMSDMIAASRKEHTEKEAGLEAQIVTLAAQLKEAQGVIQTLAGDLPRGVRAGFRASTAETTTTTKEAPNQPKADPLGEMYSWMTQSLTAKQ